MPVRHIIQYSIRTFPAWAVHLFTASGAVLGLLALYTVAYGDFILAFWLLAISILIDAVDGTFARRVNVHDRTPGFDGALLDNIVDFLNYVIVPAFMLLRGPFLPAGWSLAVTALVVLSSSYQFCQADAKTEDHFFRGFPSYWSIVVFYMFVMNIDPITNIVILTVLSILSFVPMKFLYPSRMDYLTPNRLLRGLMMLLTILWGIASAALLYMYPARNDLLVAFVSLYILLYWVISIQKTVSSMPRFRNLDAKKID